MIRLFRVFVPVGAVTLLISEILLIISAFVIASYIVLEVDPTDFLIYDGGLTRILLVLLTILAGLYFHDLYSKIYVQSKILLVQQLCLVMGVAFLLQGFMSYLDADLRVPIRLMMLGSGFAVIAIYSWRVIFSAFVLRVVGNQRILLVGGSLLLEDIGRHIQEHPEMGLKVVGYLDDKHEPGRVLPGGKVLGPVTELRGIVEATNPDRIVVGMFERRNRVPLSELLDLRFSGRIIEEVASTYETVLGRVCVKELRPSQLIYSGELGPQPQNVVLHALANRILAGIGIAIASPLMLLTAIAVRLSSPGPVLYRQVRVGLDGAPFTLYKFRSMRADAEAATGAVWAIKDDPRITKVGKFLRQFRLDELPQLFNVFRGEMSIVGPRPERPEFVQELSNRIPYYRQRHCVRPGITGWAQINHKYGDTIEDTIAKLEYDLYYIKNMSFSLDAFIIFQTMKIMLLSRGGQ